MVAVAKKASTEGGGVIVIEHRETKLDLFDERAEIELAERSAVIKALGKRVVGDVIEIGKLLTECKRICGHGNWLPWLKREFGWTQPTAFNFMNVYELSLSKVSNFDNLNLSVSGLYLLAAPSTPAEARDAVLDLAANGEQLTHAKVKDMIAQAKQETADEYEQRIGRLTTRYQEQEARLRQDLAAMSPAELENTITNALAPLQDKIRRLEEERKKRDQATPKRKDLYGRQAAGIVNSLHYLVGELTIDAAKFIEHQKIVADATQQPLKAVLTECLTNARTACLWLTTLLEQTKELDK
jgi:uncharacterized small protein (DUF1192 family)